AQRRGACSEARVVSLLASKSSIRSYARCQEIAHRASAKIDVASDQRRVTSHTVATTRGARPTQAERAPSEPRPAQKRNGSRPNLVRDELPKPGRAARGSP